MSAIAKELLKSDSRPICKSYHQMENGPVFWTHIVEMFVVAYTEMTLRSSKVIGNGAIRQRSTFY